MKNIRSALFGVLAAFAAHAAASFVTVLIVADPAAADEKDPAFVGFLALAVFLVSSVLASAAAHFLTRYRIADAYRRSDSAEEDKRLRRTSFLAAAGPGEAFHALVSFFLPGAVSLFFNPGGGYLAEAILTEGRVLAWRASPSAGNLAVYVTATLFADALVLALRALCWRIRWHALDERAKDRDAMRARDEGRTADANRTLRERYDTGSPLFHEEEKAAVKPKNAGMRSGRSAREILFDSFLVFVLMTVAGLASNVFPALIGFALSMPVAVEGYTDARESLLWLLLGGSAMLACMAGGFFFARFLGHRQADYRIANEQDRRPDILTAALSVFGGAVLHGAACLPFALNQMGNLFFAGPVQYFARFLGHGRHALFQADMFDFPVSVKIAALLFYLLFFAAAILPGILVGFRDRIRAVEYAEAAERYDRRMREREASTVWNAADADAAHVEESAGRGEDKKPARDAGEGDRGLLPRARPPGADRVRREDPSLDRAGHRRVGALFPAHGPPDALPLRRRLHRAPRAAVASFPLDRSAPPADVLRRGRQSGCEDGNRRDGGLGFPGKREKQSRAVPPPDPGENRRNGGDLLPRRHTPSLRCGRPCLPARGSEIPGPVLV